MANKIILYTILFRFENILIDIERAGTEMNISIESGAKTNSLENTKIIKLIMGENMISST